MMAHGPLMLAASPRSWHPQCSSSSAPPGRSPRASAVAILVSLAAERTYAGMAAWRRTGDAAALGFAIAHLARDLAWASRDRALDGTPGAGHRGAPAHSMHRPHAPVDDGHAAERPNRGDLLAVVPAFNEGLNLRRVVSDLSRVMPPEDILVVNDGSTDDTEALLPGLGVRWLTLSQRLGVGGAVRTGIRYAHRAGYRYVVRLDGDGQHRACDIPRLLRAVSSGRADAALGSRFLRRRIGPIGLRRFTQALLAACLTMVTRRRVTDPTSGFWLFGPRALRLLSGHHPAGYAEPELVLFLHRNRRTSSKFRSACARGLAAGPRSRPRAPSSRLRAPRSHSSSCPSESRRTDPLVTDLVQLVSIVVSARAAGHRRRARSTPGLTEESSFIWIVCAVALLGLSLWRNLLDVAAAALGVHYPPALLLLVLTFFVVLFRCRFSIVVSRHRKEIERLVEEVALLDADVRALRESVGHRNARRSDATHRGRRPRTRRRAGLRATLGRTPRSSRARSPRERRGPRRSRHLPSVPRPIAASKRATRSGGKPCG